MTKNNTMVLVGGSFTTMLLALKLKLDDPSRDITIIERAKELGGLYRTYHYDDSIKFDMGVHIYTDTTDEEIDSLVYDLLTKEDWNVLEGTKRDLAGTYFNGKLQLNTSYVDLRELPENKKSQYLGDMFLNIAQDVDPKKYSNTKDFLRAKFGDSLTEEVFAPILEKHYKQPLKELDVMATHITPINRIIIYEDKELHGLIQSEQIRPRIAFPDQRRLPECYQRKGRLLYPRQFGIDRITKALANKLENLGVKIYTDTSIQSLKLSNQKIQSMIIESPEGIQEINTARVFWGGGLPGLAKMLDIKQENNFQFQKAVFMNLVLDKPLQTEDLYYFYVFDQGFSTFRVTNYSAYCPDAINKKGYPVCVCLWLDKDLSEDEMVQLAVSELKKMAVIDDSYKVNFAKPEFTNGFPKMTVANISLMDTLRDKISGLKIENLNTVGILSKKGLFYLTEILVDAFEQARALKTQETKPRRLFTKVKRQGINV